MKSNLSHPMILSMLTHEETPTTLPFPRRVTSARRAPAKRRRGTHDVRDAREADLAVVREHLFRMIVTNEWDRSHGNRAS